MVHLHVLTLAEFRRKLQAQHGEGHWQHLPIPREEWSHQNLHMGLSENNVPLHPMVDDHYPY